MPTLKSLEKVGEENIFIFGHTVEECQGAQSQRLRSGEISGAKDKVLMWC